MKNVILLHGDCIEEMKKIPDNKVNLTVTSPPYDNIRNYNNSLEWHEDVWKNVISELFRVTANGGVVVWVVGDATIKGSETGTSFKQALWATECGFELNDTMIYQKFGSGMPHKSHRYGQTFEYMFIWSKGAPTHGVIKRYPTTGTKGKTTRRQKDGSIKKGTYNIGGGKLPNIWQYAGETRVKHPAPFPLQLAKDHIMSWSNENDIVLDPFMGSGTTGVACKKLNRRFIGIEKVEEYFTLGKTRIKEAQ